MIDFDKNIYSNLRYMGMELSKDVENSITLYLFEGLKPGGHLEAMFAYDYERALHNADTHSRQVFWATAMWVRECAPAEAQGSYEAITNWCKNEELRNAFRIKCEKKAMWDTLKD